MVIMNYRFHKRAQSLPFKVKEIFDSVDLIIHAGDIEDTKEVIGLPA